MNESENLSSWKTEDNYVNRIRFSNINNSIKGMIGKKTAVDKGEICIDFDEDGENYYLRKETLKLVEYGNQLWGVNNWNWSVTKQELDFVDYNASKFCAGAVSFVEIKLKEVDIIRENCGYASCCSKRKGMAIQKARRNATTNALLETFLSFGGNVAMGIPRASMHSVQLNKRNTVRNPRLSPMDTTTARSATSPRRLAGDPTRYSSSITLDIKPKGKRSLYPKQRPRREYSSSPSRGAVRRPPSWYPVPPKDSSEFLNVPPKKRSRTPPQYAAARASHPLPREERPLAREERSLAKQERPLPREKRPLAREEFPSLELRQTTPSRSKNPSSRHKLHQNNKQPIAIRRSIDLNKLTLNAPPSANQDPDYHQSANIQRKPSWHDLEYNYDRPISPALITDDGTLNRDMYPLYDIPTRDNAKNDTLPQREEIPEKTARAPSYAGSYRSPPSTQPKRPPAAPSKPETSKQSPSAPKTLQQSPSRSEKRSNSKSAHRPVTKPERRKPEQRSLTKPDHQPITDPDHRSITHLDHRSTTDLDHHSTTDPDHRSLADLEHHSTTDPTHKYERSSKIPRSLSPPMSDTEKLLSFDDFTTPKRYYTFSRGPDPCYNKLCGQPCAGKSEKLSRASSPVTCEPCQRQQPSPCPGSCLLPRTCSGVPCNTQPCQPTCKLNCKLLWDQDSPETTLYKPYRICSFDECASGYCLLMTTGVDCTPRSMLRSQSPPALPPPDSNVSGYCSKNEVENPDKGEEGNVEEMTEEEVRAERKRRQRQAQEESAIQLDRNKKTFYWPEGLKRSRRSGKRLRKRSMRLIWRGVSGTSRRETKLTSATSYTF